MAQNAADGELASGVFASDTASAGGVPGALGQGTSAADQMEITAEDTKSGQPEEARSFRDYPGASRLTRLRQELLPHEAMRLIMAPL